MNEAVVLLHGLARSRRSMGRLAQALQQAGYQVENCAYPSTRLNITEAADSTIPAALDKLSHADSIHFVTHSLGGILLRDYLQRKVIHKLGRVVMLAPPNQGSVVADWLQSYRLFSNIFGPAAMQLGTGPSSRPRQLTPADVELGIIAGSRSLNPLFGCFMAKPNDGTVSVSETRLQGMRDHLTLPATHPFIMNNREVIRQCIYFLQHGQFDRLGNHH